MNIFGLIKKLGKRRFKILYSIWILWQIVKLPLGVYKLNILNLAFEKRENIEYYGMIYIAIYGLHIVIKWILDVICYPEELLFHRDCSLYLHDQCGGKYLNDLMIQFKNNNSYDKVAQTTMYIWRIMANLKHMIEFSIRNFFIPFFWICTQDIELAITIFAIRFIVNLISSDLIRFIKYLNKKLNSQMIETDTKGRLHVNVLKYIHPDDSVYDYRLKQIEKDRNINLKLDENITWYWRIYDLTIDIPDLVLTYLVYLILSNRTEIPLTNLLLIFTQSNKMLSSMQGLIHILQRFYIQKASIDDFFESLSKAKEKPKINNKINFDPNLESITIKNIFIELKKKKKSKIKKTKTNDSYLRWRGKAKKNKDDQDKMFERFESSLGKVELKFGELTSLEGKIGSGKSSFLKAITQYNDTTKNIGVIVNKEILNINDLQPFISYSPQEENYKAYDNISCKDVLSGFKDNITEELKEELLTEIITGICIQIPLLNQFFDNNFDIERGLNLKYFFNKDYNNVEPSGGQKGILTIVRHLFTVVANNKKILILDEVDKAIQIDDAVAIWRFFVNYVKKHKIHIVYVSHHSSPKKFANQRIVFETDKQPIVDSMSYNE
jgi:ABC-type lipoprotein export system ATPase subunit